MSGITGRFHLTMTARLLLAFAVLLIPLVLYSAWSYQRSLDERRQLAVDDAAGTTETAAAIVSGALGGLDGTLQAISLTLGQLNEPLDQASAGPYLTTVFANTPIVRALFLMDPEGRVIAAQHGEGLGTDLSGRPYTRALLDGQESVLGDLAQGSQTGSPVVTMARTVRGPDGALRGLLAAAFYSDRLAEFLPRTLPADAGLTVLDSSGRVVFSSTFPDMAWDVRDQRDAPGVQAALAGQRVVEEEVVTPEDGESRLVVAAPVGRYGWAASYSRGTSTIEGPLLSLFQRQLVALGAVSLGALLAALILSHSLTGSLRRLTGYARAFGHGDRTRQAPLHGPWEVQTLAGTFNQMASEIDARFAEREELLERAEAARADAEHLAGRIARLQDVTAALSEALTSEAVMDAIAEQGVAALGAYAGGIGLLSPDGEELIVVRAVGYPPDVLARSQRYPITADNPPAEAVRTGLPVWVESAAQETSRFPRHAAAAVDGTGSRAIAAIPLADGEAVIGALAFSFSEEQRFSAEDRAFMVALARQCAQALSRARLYQAERAARAEAETANRAKDEFLSTLSHELRTPLTPILGWVGMLRRRSLDEAAQERALEVIERSARAQAQLINDLLDVSRIVTGKLHLDVRPIDLNDVVVAAIGVIEPAAEAKSIAVETRFDPAIGPAAGDPDRLQQVFWNLLSNAVKFTPAGGRIDVTVDHADDEAIVSIEDTGEGIAPAFLPHIFDRFRQADASSTRRFGGLGLGLAIVRYLVELHGGTVTASSAGEGQGTTFVVRLPLVAPAPFLMPVQRDGLADTALESGSLAAMQVLVLDDEADSRELLRALLEAEGAMVLDAASCAEALSLMEVNRPDVIVADIAMPDEDGYRFIERLRDRPTAAGGSIPALALTAYAGGGHRRRALVSGYQGHLVKPVEPQALVTALIRLTGRPAADRSRG
jgi:signal transduction histidine kinase/ActR/RegA family two-component response regulator